MECEMSLVNPGLSGDGSSAAPPPQPSPARVASALQPFIPKSIVCLRDGTWRQSLAGDLFAGVTVGVIALPLAIAFAIASHVRPEQGLYTAVVAGFFISLLGGSRVQIGGPTGAFVVIIAGVVDQYGYGGLALATLMAGAILIALGVAKL